MQDSKGFFLFIFFTNKKSTKEKLNTLKGLWILMFCFQFYFILFLNHFFVFRNISVMLFFLFFVFCCFGHFDHFFFLSYSLHLLRCNGFFIFYFFGFKFVLIMFVFKYFKLWSSSYLIYIYIYFLFFLNSFCSSCFDISFMCCFCSSWVSLDFIPTPMLPLFAKLFHLP